MIISGFPESQLGWGHGRYTRDQANRESVVHGNHAPKETETGKDQGWAIWDLEAMRGLSGESTFKPK